MADDVQLVTINKNLAFIAQEIQRVDRDAINVASAVKALLKEMESQHRVLDAILDALERR